MGKNAGSGTATNNSKKYFKLKVDIRVNSLPERDIKVLDCFAGEGKIWNAVKSKFKHKIDKVGLDINYYSGVDNIICDSERFLFYEDINKYDVIDIDSWGSPINHLDIIFKKKYKGIIHCTYCNPISFNPNKKISTLFYGVEHYVIKNKPSLFAKDLEAQIKNYLISNGVTKVTGFFRKSTIIFTSIVCKSNN